MNLIVKLLTIIAVLSPFTAMSAMAESEYWKQRTSLFELLPIGKDDIVFLGNSITDGGEFSELFGMPQVKNRGINSDVITGVEKRLHQVVKGHPKKIFLLIGINDISHNLSASELAASYEQLVKKIRTESPQTKLYVQSIMPINNDFGRYRALKGRENVIPELNEHLKTLAKNNGAIYIDLWPALADKNTGKLRPEFTNDGLHLTGRGYKAWTEAIKNYVVE